MRLLPALLLSFLLHLLLLFPYASPAPQSAGGPRARMLAKLLPGETSARQSRARAVAEMAARGPAPPAQNAIHSVAPRGRVGDPSRLSAGLGDAYEGPSVMDVASYRLALGRALSTLLDSRVRAMLPAGELLFLVRGRLGRAPELSLLTPIDPVLDEQLYSLFGEAVARVAMPPAWQSQAYGIELRVVVGG